MTQIKNILLILLLAVGWTACSKTGEKPEPVQETVPVEDSTVSGFKTYTIQAGQHYATENPIQELNGTELAFAVRFDSSCRYETKNPENQDDINKLMGFSDNGFQHHENSARVGWRWKNRKIELFAYCYAGGQRSFSLLGKTSIGDTLQLAIKLSPAGYEFQLNGVSTFMKRSATGSTIRGYLLYPYFGGDEPAPHRMRMEIFRY
ncbi:hypothetical protein [Flavihumibacter sp. UBA7668]|uniref:hypothetical protein n=1 Tax=Flavihumibacter sp. UBA7668 TaxID=1946542 RepID=UPI0025C2E79F|nr:hypothetical protein [Flavihumibacter sp. UBA7668]